MQCFKSGGAAKIFSARYPADGFNCASTNKVIQMVPILSEFGVLAIHVGLEALFSHGESFFFLGSELFTLKDAVFALGKCIFAGQ